MLKLRLDTTDLMVFREVVLENEYRLPDRMDGWSVLDVGAHIGCFALACLIRGAKLVECYESDPDNFKQLDAFSLPYDDLYHHELAVWRSDKVEPQIRVGRHTQRENYAANGPFVANPDHWVQSRPLDSLIHTTGLFTLLKLDCEGSEYPILLTSKRLGEIPVLCGEWHTVSPAASRPVGLGNWSAYHLRSHLEGLGYTCAFVQMVNYPLQGLFWAWKDRPCPFKLR